MTLWHSRKGRDNTAAQANNYCPLPVPVTTPVDTVWRQWSQNNRKCRFLPLSLWTRGLKEGQQSVHCASASQASWAELLGEPTESLSDRFCPWCRRQCLQDTSHTKRTCHRRWWRHNRRQQRRQRHSSWTRDSYGWARRCCPLLAAWRRGCLCPAPPLWRWSAFGAARRRRGSRSRLRSWWRWWRWAWPAAAAPWWHRPSRWSSRWRRSGSSPRSPRWWGWWAPTTRRWARSRTRASRRWTRRCRPGCRRWGRPWRGPPSAAPTPGCWPSWTASSPADTPSVSSPAAT